MLNFISGLAALNGYDAVFNAEKFAANGFFTVDSGKKLRLDLFASPGLDMLLCAKHTLDSGGGNFKVIRIFDRIVLVDYGVDCTVNSLTIVDSDTVLAVDSDAKIPLASLELNEFLDYELHQLFHLYELRKH